MNKISFRTTIPKSLFKTLKPVDSADAKFHEVSLGFVNLCNKLSLDQVLKVHSKSSEIRWKVGYAHVQACFELHRLEW